MTHSTASLRNPTDDKLTGRRLAGRRLAGRRLSGRRLTGTVTALSLSLCACTVEVQPEGQGGLEGAQPASASNVERDRSSLGSGDLTVLMVVDRSGSMMYEWEGTPKWQIARNAIDQAIVGVEEELTIGALLFPMEAGCNVAALHEPGQIDFQRGGSFQEEWADSAVSYPAGATPLGEAFRQADSAILQAEELGLLEQRFRVVVITDGEPTCGEDPNELVAYADLWREKGVEVRVMGLPGSSGAAALLNRIAGVELFEDPRTGEVLVPDAGARWEEGDPDAPGYIAPPSGDDVDGSLHSVVR